jgi:hypothetical protein
MFESPDKESLYKKWAPIINSLNIQDKEKKKWLSEYAESIEEKIENDDSTPSGVTSSFDGILLPIAMKIAAQTMGLDLLDELDEEKYTNEKRKKILEDIFNEVDTDYQKLEDMKKEFTKSFGEPLNAPSGTLFYMDFKYENKNDKIVEIIKSLQSPLQNVISFLLKSDIQ